MKVSRTKELNNIIKGYSLAVIAVCAFIYGYFPQSSSFSSTVIEPPSHVNNIPVEVEEVYKPQIERLVLIVIDALRKDFTTNDYMPFLTAQLRNEGCLLDVQVESPTVTLPRIKAITTGNVPQFVDVILNFDNSKLQGDSLLHRAKHAGKKIVFFGDETWLKLYPDMFLRSEGTTSFYVTDYTEVCREVDDNVTRHLPNELEKADWDILILHYLGLDHIGHIYGPFHHLIRQKLAEMDAVIQSIVEKIDKQTRKTVIAVTGDHGMRDTGGHGGSSIEETVVPFAALGLRCRGVARPIAQVDIAPTVAALLAIPLPADSIGVIQPVLCTCRPETLAYMLHYNSLNLIAKDPELATCFHDVFQQHAELLSRSNRSSTTSSELLLVSYGTNLEKASRSLLKVSGSDQIGILIYSLLMLLVACVSLFNTKFDWKNLLLYFICATLMFLNHIFVDYSFYPIFFICFLTILISLLLLLNNLGIFLKMRALGNLYSAILIGGSMSQIILLASSSFIEEEHQIWFYLWNALLVYHCYKKLQNNSLEHAFYCLVLITLTRIARDANHIGNISSEPDISDWLLQDNNALWLNCVFVTGLVVMFYFCVQSSDGNPVVITSSFLSIIAIMYYRFNLKYSKIVIPVTITKVLISTIFVNAIYKRQNVYKTTTICWLLWVCLLMRQQNVILLATFIVASNILRRIHINHMAQLWLGMIFYFCQGTFNNLASIDISAGYVGLTYYSPVLASFQILCHTYAFQTLSILLFLSNSKACAQVDYWRMMVLHRLSTLTYTCAISIIHRYHIFIWTVFSPKLLFEISQSMYIFILLLLYKVFSSAEIFTPEEIKF